MSLGNSQFLLLGSCAAGAAAAALAAWVRSSVARSRPLSAASWEFEVARRIELCRGNAAYRWFEPVVDELAARYRRAPGDRLAKVAVHLTAAGEPLPWKPEEYLAVKMVEGILGGVAALVIGNLFGGLFWGIVLGVATPFLLQKMAIGDLKSRAEKRMLTIKRRLPFAVDLMALMLEAGGGLLESLTTIARDMRGHALGLELQAIVGEINLGRSLNESLVRFQRRVPDDDIAELVFMINKGDEFGTPMAQTFRTQAEQMRLKRTQWAEKAAGAAQANIVLPGTVIMVACLIIIGAPFLLAALRA